MSRLNDAGARLRPFGLRLTRRRLLAASGATLAAGAPAVLAACGTDEEDDEATPAEEAELLTGVLGQQLAVLTAARAIGQVDATAAVGEAAMAVRNLRERSTEELRSTITDLGGMPEEEPADLEGGESAIEGLARQLETSIAFSIDAIGELAPERRQPVQRAITEDAAGLAAVRSVLGEDVAPDAFVMGPPASAEEAP